MKSLRAKLLPALVIVTILSLTIRLIWVASSRETGWETLAGQWKDATWGQMVGLQPPVHHRVPSEQADFWLPEVDRVLHEHPTNAALAMGAAWVLDQPGTDYTDPNLAGGNVCHLLPRPFTTRNLEQERAYELRCRPRCLELAALATSLEPDNPRWWRMRAVLQFSPWRSDSRPTPDSQGLAMLEEAARHDPENGLYDYLAAMNLWTTSATQRYAAIDPAADRNAGWLEIHDEDRFASGTALFARAQQKDRLSAGGSELDLVTGFLRHTTLSRREQADFAAPFRVKVCEQYLLVEMWRWLRERAQQLRSEADLAGELRTRRQLLRFLNQTSELASLHARQISIFRREALQRELEIAALAPELFGESEVAAVSTELAATTTRVFAARAAPAKPPPLWNIPDSAPWLVAAIAIATGLPLLMLAAAAALFARLLGASADVDPPLGLARHLIAWCVPYALTFAFLGAAPAGIVAPTTVFWMVCGVALTLLVLLWRPLRLLFSQLIGALREPAGPVSTTARARLFTVRVLLGSASGLLLVLPMILIREPLAFGEFMKRSFVQIDDFSAFPPPVSIQLRNCPGIGAESLAIWLDASSEPWRWALLQWLAYVGLYASPIAALGCVAAWYAARRARANSQSVGHYWATLARGRWAGLLRCLSRSAGMAGMILLTAYLTLASLALVAIDDKYQQRLISLRAAANHRPVTATGVRTSVRHPPVASRCQKDVRSLAAHAAA